MCKQACSKRGHIGYAFNKNCRRHICGGPTWAKGKPPANRDNEMRKEKKIRSITSIRLIVSQAVIALLLVAATAGAQTDAGKDKKDRPFFDVKSSTPMSKGPDTVFQP